MAVRRVGSRPLLLFVVSALALAPSMRAQTLSSVSGVVRDTAGAPMAGVQLAVEAVRSSAISDVAGRFWLTGVPTGTASVRARRLGFSSLLTTVQVPPRGVDTVAIRMVALPTMLSPMIVRAHRVEFTGRLAGYYDRLSRRGGGVFITRNQIDRENPRMLSHLLAHVPGVAAARMRGGGTGVRLRSRACWPLVYLDGMPMPSGDMDVDALSPTSIHGIELYLGSTTAPIRYQQTRGMSSCGTILIWSRGPDTDPVTRIPQTAAYLEQLVASLSVFTVDQVDQPAQLDPNRTLDVSYPPSLFAEKVAGSVVAEFVVDVRGRVEEDSFGIVSSAHPLFSEAVRQAIPGVTYTPAVRSGRPVRQLVQQPFTFSLAPSVRASASLR